MTWCLPSVSHPKCACIIGTNCRRSWLNQNTPTKNQISLGQSVGMSLLIDSRERERERVLYTIYITTMITCRQVGRDVHKADSSSTNLMSARQTVLFHIFNLAHNEQKITKSTLSQTDTMRGKKSAGRQQRWIDSKMAKWQEN